MRKLSSLEKILNRVTHQWTVESRLPNRGGGGGGSGDDDDDDDDEDDNNTYSYTQTLILQTVFTFSPFVK